MEFQVFKRYLEGKLKTDFYCDGTHYGDGNMMPGRKIPGMLANTKAR